MASYGKNFLQVTRLGILCNLEGIFSLLMTTQIFRLYYAKTRLTWSFKPTLNIVISPTISIQLVPHGLCEFTPLRNQTYNTRHEFGPGALDFCMKPILPLEHIWAQMLHVLCPVRREPERASIMPG